MDFIKIIVPLLVAALTATAGIVAYLFQKRADRQNELVKLRQEKYQFFLDSFQNHIDNQSDESHQQYLKALLALFVVASDQVICSIGNLQKYLADTSNHGNKRDMVKVGKLLTASMKAMRNDCFEKSKLDQQKMLDILPIEGVNGEENFHNKREEKNRIELTDSGHQLIEKRIIDAKEGVGGEKNPDNEDTGERKNKMESLVDSGHQMIEKRIIDAEKSIMSNYENLMKIGNPPGRNTADIAFITYLAKSLSGLSDSQISILRSEGILTI
ncbi:MAG: hypothetical protein D3923_15080 [Candidatus Electrothrix sp. AR3]|nr:hypothetical protein [Candidatus Electrothrix sp. AR3]